MGGLTLRRRWVFVVSWHHHISLPILGFIIRRVLNLPLTSLPTIAIYLSPNRPQMRAASTVRESKKRGNASISRPELGLVSCRPPSMHPCLPVRLSSESEKLAYRIQSVFIRGATSRVF